MNNSLKDKIGFEMRNAMKTKNNLKRDTLRVLMAEIDRGQLGNDQEIIAIIKKMIENIEITTNNKEEIDVLMPYIPTQLSEIELNTALQEQIIKHNYTSKKDMGVIMNYFKTTYPNLYDGKVLSGLVRASFT